MSELVQEMRNKPELARQKMGLGNKPSPKRMNLTGKNAIVEPGGQITIRLLPRWDIKDAYVKRDGKWVTNPDYKGGPVYFEAWEHWWDDEVFRRHRDWCLKTFDRNAPCPLCRASLKLRESPDQQDRRYGSDLARTEVFLFNAVAKDLKTRRCALTEAGVPDIRVLYAQKTIFVGISNIMTGGGRNKLARGDITNHRQGYDIKLTRPAVDSGDRWKVNCAPKPSPICAEDEKAAWEDWPNLLIDLPGWVASWMSSYESLYLVYFKALPDGPEADALQ